MGARDDRERSSPQTAPLPNARKPEALPIVLLPTGLLAGRLDVCECRIFQAPSGPLIST